MTNSSMDLPLIIKQLPAAAGVIRAAKLRDYTTFRLGGACPLLIDCPDAEVLAESVKQLHSARVEHLVIGQGSNLLVADAGIDAVVLRYCSAEPPVLSLEAGAVWVPGHILIDDLARISIEQSVGDLSFCSGIPGTLAGAIVGNAGAFGRQIGDHVEGVEVVRGDGEHCEIGVDALEFGYRTSALKRSGDIVLAAKLRLESADPCLMQLERNRILELRRTKHPDWKNLPCAGSVFRNIEPTSAAERRQAAGWFLEEAGVMGFHEGGARLFERHANIVVADPNATAYDVYRMTERMIAAVEQRFGFRLEREIRLLGAF